MGELLQLFPTDQPAQTLPEPQPKIASESTDEPAQISAEQAVRFGETPTLRALASLGRETETTSDTREDTGYKNTQPEAVKKQREPLLKEFDDANGTFQRSANIAGLFGQKNGMTYTYGMFAVQRLARSATGDQANDIADFGRTLKEKPNERERAVRILMCEGLGMLERAIVTRRQNGESVPAAQLAVGEIHPNLKHSAAARNYSEVIQATDALMGTFRYADNDGVKALQELRYAVADSIGIKNPYKITMQKRTEAWESLRNLAPTPPDTAA